MAACTLDCRGRRLTLGGRTLLMGILNITPDSFSDGGRYLDPEVASAKALKLVAEGADILDLGGESSRPGAKPVALKEELKRTIPVIKKLSGIIKIPISIDTAKPEVARRALDNGASIVNDITGLKDPRMAKICARYKSGVVIMHMKGTPRSMQKNPVYSVLISEIIEFLGDAIRAALDTGIRMENIIIDPGIGFGKTPEHNLEIIKNLREFKVLGAPILVGTSRKSFIGAVLGRKNPEERIFGTAGVTAFLTMRHAEIIRVHDVRAMKDVVTMFSRCAEYSSK